MAATPQTQGSEESPCNGAARKSFFPFESHKVVYEHASRAVSSQSLRVHQNAYSPTLCRLIALPEVGTAMALTKKALELKQYLRDANLPEEFSNHCLRTLKMGSLEEFVSHVSSANYEAELKSRVVDTCPATKGKPIILARVRSAWRSARASLQGLELSRQHVACRLLPWLLFMHLLIMSLVCHDTTGGQLQGTNASRVAWTEPSELSDVSKDLRRCRACRSQSRGGTFTISRGPMTSNWWQ